MSERKWRPVGDKPQRAGDVFGDFQVGEAFVVTYHLDNTPNVRVSAYFGVERHQSKAVTFLPAEPARYSPVSVISLEVLEGPDKDVVDSVDIDNPEIFPFDYSTRTTAMKDVHEMMWDWQAATWGVSDFWDGKDLPRD